MDRDQAYRLIYENLPHGVVLLDRDGAVLTLNRAALAMLACALQAPTGVGHNLLPGLAQPHRDALRHLIHRVFSGDTGALQFELGAPGGPGRWLELHAAPMRDAAGRLLALLGVVWDVTEALGTVEALRTSEELHRLLAENSNDLITLREIDGTPIYGSPSFARLMGRSPAESMELLFERFHPEDQAMGRRAWEEVVRGTPRYTTFRYQHLDGRWHWLEAWGTLVSYGGRQCVLSVSRDVTRRKQAEDLLRESQKMEAIGTLAGGIAHDFNNVLAGILGNVSLALEDLDPAHPACARLQQIEKSGLRGRKLVQQILAFARRQPKRLVQTALGPLARDAVDMLRTTLPSSAQLALVLHPQPVHAVVDPTQVAQVVMNLVTNAWQALPDRTGRIEVGIEPVLLDVADAQRLGCQALERHVHLWVRDDGIGMDETTRARIFEPFFTTKAPGAGTGLGLSVTRGIVAEHGGCVLVDSSPGAGSTFHVYLPACETPAAAGEPTALREAARAQGERILYVDDDDVIVMMVEAMLHRLGYRVYTCNDAQQALELVGSDPAAIDVVVTDFNMPGSSGLEVARALGRIRPGLPVVIASGNITPQLEREAALAGVPALLQKQDLAEELGPLLQRLLHPAAPG
jgi:PAS domain S-box-containing protein